MQEGKIKPNISYSYYLMDMTANHLFTTWRFLFCLLLMFVLDCQNAKCSEAEDNNRVYCDNPGRVLNGRVYYFAPGIRNSSEVRLENEMTEFPEGSTLQYYCESGHWLQGSNSLRCESDGYWSGGKPTCMKDCGQIFFDPRVRIGDGQETEYSDSPWIVSISRQEEDGSRFVCLGALFNSHSVVTAAHCLENGRTYVLRLGKHNWEINGDDSDVLNRTSTRVIIHPDYSSSTMDSDIGLILFEPTIQYSSNVQPICLPTIATTIRNIRPGRRGYVSIWGSTADGLLLDDGLPLADELLLVDFPVRSNEDCKRSYRQQNLSLPLTGNMFCAGHYNGTYFVCAGDGGSPLVFYDTLSERFTLEGLVSFLVKKPTDAQDCGFPGRYPVFTKVFRFLPWIYENVQ